MRMNRKTTSAKRVLPREVRRALRWILLPGDHQYPRDRRETSAPGPRPLIATLSTMRPFVPLASLVLAFSPGSFVAHAAAPAEVAAAKGEEETELDHKMEDMNGAFRKLRRQISDASAKASSLELVGKLRSASEESAKLIPAKAEKVPEADRAKFVADYQAKMKDFMAELDKLKAALEADKFDEAATILTKLGNLQKSGHREFRAQKKD
jgi:soluble cytochrome b562